MKMLAQQLWSGEDHAHDMHGAQFSVTDNGDYVVHWISASGNTVCGMYAAPERRHKAVEEYLRRCSEALKIREYKCPRCTEACEGC